MLESNEHAQENEGLLCKDFLVSIHHDRHGGARVSLRNRKGHRGQDNKVEVAIIRAEHIARPQDLFQCLQTLVPMTKPLPRKEAFSTFTNSLRHDTGRAKIIEIFTSGATRITEAVAGAVELL
ncbi:hypothetical protein DOTSEDRAFT_29291 [Dothistroma septosporum NZE10]|uniref:Uncharacterized protein n=1 Tax=Dothistroma septosporum (strain NZE10 / CBS 128990) TaxID=675120 RepID=N1PDE8_DOTSN|nr:hypothetical protein DOTSEDRAFT_29291 [Dothistroma septosporum NZE10]